MFPQDVLWQTLKSENISLCILVCVAIENTNPTLATLSPCNRNLDLILYQT